MWIQTFQDRECTIEDENIDFPEIGSHELESGTVNEYTIQEETVSFLRGAVALKNIVTAPAKLFCQYTENVSKTVYIKPESGLSFVRLNIKCGQRSVIDPTFTPANAYRYQCAIEVYNLFGQNTWDNASSGGTSISSDTEYNFYTAFLVSGGKPYLCMFYMTTGNNVHGFFASRNLFDGSIRPDTKSETPTVTPSGWYGTGHTTPGNMDFSNDPSALSHANATAHGLRAYAVSDAQMERLYTTLWSDSIWNKWKNQKFNPIAGILSYHRLPISTEYTSMEYEVSICGQKYVLGTPLSAPRVISNCFPGVDCNNQFSGALLPIPEISGSFLDYQPYCSAVLHLPFIGNIPIDVNAISGGGIAVRYWIDVCSGNCIAHVKTVNRDGSSIIYGEYPGNCAYCYPITGNDNGGFAVLGAAAGIATAGIVTAASGGSAAPFAASIIAGGAGAAQAQHHTQQVGTWPANTAAMCDLRVYLVITRPAYLTPDKYPEIEGRPSGVGKKIGDFSGYLSGEMHADNIDGLTDAEKRQIESYFQSGVIM